ncbi:MAG: SH3 domain-containing protein [Gemmataceae bacterium]
MRQVPVAGAVVMLLFAGGSALAQAPRDLRYVQVDQIEVRSGPSDAPEFYVTNRLRRGQAVEVVETMPGGWLAVKPPEGSFSYINTRFLRHMLPEMPTHVVTLDGVKVPVYIGSEVLNRRPTVVGCWLEPGAQVVSRGKPKSDEDGTWMPIEAPARERRYVRASQVERSATSTDSVIRTASATVPASGSTFTPTSPAAAAPVGNEASTADQLWARAQQAERNGQYAEAVRLYALVGAETARSNPNMSAVALQRANFLQTGAQNYGASVGPAVGSPTYPVATPASTSPLQIGGPTTSAPATRMPVVPTSASANPPRGYATRNGQTSWLSFRGILRRSGRTIEGQQTYALDDPITLRPILYATPARGVDFESHVNRTVTLTGYSFWRGDLRNNFMSAVHLVPDP